jgi:hypothetical protein
VDYEPSLREEKARLILTLQQLVCGTTSDRSLGLKNLPVNLLALPRGHTAYYDEEPLWILVPILTLKETKEWNSGKQYWVMVLAEDKGSYKALVTNGYEEGSRHRCEYDDIFTATKLLEHFVQANADALLKRPADCLPDTAQSIISPLDLFPTDDTSLQGKKEIEKKRNEMGDTIKALETEKYTVKVPCMKVTTSDIGNLQVMKVLLKDNVPDPALVATKASISWSARTHQELLPACVWGESVDEDEDEAHAFAREFYEAGLRASRESELVGRQVMVSSVEMADDDLSDDEESDYPHTPAAAPRRVTLSPEEAHTFDDES